MSSSGVRRLPAVGGFLSEGPGSGWWFGAGIQELVHFKGFSAVYIEYIEGLGP